MIEKNYYLKYNPDNTEVTYNILNIIKKYASSKSFLISVLFFTLYVIMVVKSGASLKKDVFYIFSLILMICGKNTDDLGLIMDILSNGIFDDLFDNIFDSLNFYGLIGDIWRIISNFPEILIVIGMWITYISAKNSSKLVLSYRGFNIIEIGMFIPYMFNILVSLIWLFQALKFVVASYNDIVEAVWFIIIIYVISVITYIFIMNKLFITISFFQCKNVKEYPYKGISNFVIFWFIFNGIFSLIRSGISPLSICFMVGNMLIGCILCSCKQEIYKSNL